MADLCVVVGAVCLVVAAWLFSWLLGLAALGVLFIVVGVLFADVLPDFQMRRPNGEDVKP